MKREWPFDQFEECSKSTKLDLYEAIRMSITDRCDLIGRDHEANILRDFIDRARKSKVGSCIYITGHPGVGKTLCVDHVLKDLNGVSFSLVNLCVFKGDLMQHM